MENIFEYINYPHPNFKTLYWCVDKDKIKAILKRVNFKYLQGTDEFRYKPKSADEFIDYTLELNVPMVIGKFLVKEFCEDFGITIDHIKKLKPLVDQMDDKHLYVKYIYERMIENASFEITEEDRLKAYDMYKKQKLTEK